MPPVLTQSEITCRIIAKDTRPDLIVRIGLHRRGCRFTLHSGDLPVRPDPFLLRHRLKAVIHASFWRAHKGCPDSTISRTRTECWTTKLTRNKAGGHDVRDALRLASWRTQAVWECTIGKLPVKSLTDGIILWLKSDEPMGQISHTCWED